MDKMEYYCLAFKQGNISDKDTERYIRFLSEETLHYITDHSFDRKLIKPIMKMAWIIMEKEEKPRDFDAIVKEILRDKREMFILMSEFC